MKKITLLLFFLISSFVSVTSSQNVIHTENFEGSDFNGYAIGNADTGTDYPSQAFVISDPDRISRGTVGSFTFKGILTGNATNFIGGEDINFTTDGGFYNGHSYIELDPIDITSKSNLSIDIDVAFPSISLTRYEMNDFFIVEYRIDGGSYTKVLAFFGDGDTGSPSLGLRRDNNLNGVLDAGETSNVNTAMTRFSLNLDAITGGAVSGSTIEIRVRFSMPDSQEEFAFDNIILKGNTTNTAPVFENSKPAITSITTTGFTLETDINEAGTIYYIVLADGATVPTAAEVKAGTGNAGASVVTSGSAAVTSGDFSHNFSITGLTVGTAYDVYVVAQDDEATPLLQTTPTLVNGSTLKPLANLVISEIMYNPPESGTDEYEYIELYNAGTTTVDLTGYSFSKGVNHTFTTGSIAAGDYFVIAGSYKPTKLDEAFGAGTTDANWTSGGLSNGGEEIELVDDAGRVVDYVQYDDVAPWPTGNPGPDGKGTSIELRDLTSDNNVGANWSSSTDPRDIRTDAEYGKNLLITGTPGAVSIFIKPASNNILYVSKTATGNGTGDSWTNAVPELADALVWAKQNYDASWATTPLQIFVAKGTYKPLYSPEDGANFGTDKDRDNSFLMVNNVQVYGGFDPANGIDDLTDSRILPNSGSTGTILSGDVNDDDGSDFANNSENLIRIIVSSGDVGKALLNGFTITGANGENNNNITVNGNPVYQCSGAGIYNSISSPLYENLLLYGNYNTESGGGMFSYQSSATLRNIVFRNNKAKDGGAIANQDNSSPVLLNVSFIENEATTDGGAIYNVDNSMPTFVNITVDGNTDTGGGDGIYNEDTSSPSIFNSIVWDVVHGSYTAKNSLIIEKTDTSNGNLDATGITEAKIFTDAANGDYTLKNTSLTVNTGSNTLYTNAGGTLTTDKDLAGSPRLFNGSPTIDAIDMGAYELQENPFKPAPTSNYVTQVYAGDDKTVADLQATGIAIKWYAAATGGTALATTTSLVDNTMYYASQTIDAIESTERLAVTVKRISEANQNMATGSTVADLVTTPTSGATVKWYSAATGGTALENTEVLTTGTYYIAQTIPSLTIKSLGNGFSQPFGIAVQSDGKILVADTNNNVIKRMDADGTNIQILGTGFNKPRGVTLQSDGKILVADAGNNSIKRMDADGSNIVTLNSTFNQPHGIAVQSNGKILVADSYNSAIKRMDADGANIVTLGSGFSYPYGIAVQSDGKILVADAENSAVKRMDADGSNIQILGTGFGTPSGVAVQSDGKILVVDGSGNNIKRMDSDGSAIEILSRGFNIPRGVAVQSDGKILVTDTNNNAIKRITEVATSNRIAVAVVIIPSAPITSYATQVFAGDSKTLAALEITGTAIKWYDAATAGTLLDNTTVLADKTTYYASQTINGVESTGRTAVTAKKISEASQTFNASDNPTVANLVATSSTGTTVKWFTTATGGTVLDNTDALSSGTYYVEQNTPLSVAILGSGFNPFDIAIQSDGKIVVADYGNNAIKRMDADGTNVETLGSGFRSPSGVAIQSDGKIVVADYGNNAIKRMDADGANVETLGSGFNPWDIAIQSDGKIVVADYGNNAIKRMDADGKNIETLGSGFNLPTGVAIQSDGKIVVTDYGYNAIKRMDADGNNIETLGSGFRLPLGVAIQSDGKIVVADSGNYAIKKMDADGNNIETLGSEFSNLFDVAIQSDGKIVVADKNNNAIKRITDAYTSNRVAVSVVVKATPTISFADFSKTYGDAAFDLSATSTSTETVTYSVVAGGTGEVTLSGKNITIVKAGTVTLKASVAENDTYEAAEKIITLTINKAELTVTADNKSRVYGDANPAFTISYSGFKNSDDASDLTAPLTTSTTATQTSDVGTYDIALANGVATNYSFTYVKGRLAITKAELTVTADNKSKVYGDANPTFTFAYSGFKNSDDATDLNKTPVASTSATVNSNVGNYDIQVAFPSSKSNSSAPENYSFKFVKGTLTITKASQTITFGAVTHSNKDVFDLTATSSSGLAITYTSSNTSVATISGNTVTVLSAGVTTITAKQAGNSNYEAATDVDQTLTITVLGVEDNILLSQLKLYPNPVVNKLVIESNTTIDKVIIYNLLGKEVIIKQPNSKKVAVDFSNQAAGVYLVKVMANNKVKTLKVVKNK